MFMEWKNFLDIFFKKIQKVAEWQGFEPYTHIACDLLSRQSLLLAGCALRLFYLFSSIIDSRLFEQIFMPLSTFFLKFSRPSFFMTCSISGNVSSINRNVFSELSHASTVSRFSDSAVMNESNIPEPHNDIIKLCICFLAASSEITSTVSLAFRLFSLSIINCLRICMKQKRNPHRV